MADPYADIASPDPYADIASHADASAPLSGNALSGAARALEANLPFVDRAVAAAKSALPQGYGGTGQDYAANLAAERSKNEQFAEQNPWTNAVGGLVASAPLAAVPGVGEGSLGARAAHFGLLGAGAGAVQGASGSPDLTNLPDVGTNAAIGAATGGALGAAAPYASAGLSRLVPAAAEAGVPTFETIGKMKNDAYKAADALGVSYQPEAFAGLVNKIKSDAAASNIDADLHKGAASVISNLQDTAESGEPITLTQLDQKRQLASRDASGTPADQFFGNQIRSNIDNFIQNAPPDAMASGSGPDAAAAIQTARNLNTRYAKSEALNDALEHAKDLAGGSGSGANLDNATRQALRRVQDSQSGWTPDEAALLSQGIRGAPGQNMLRMVGKLAPTGLIGGLEALSGAGGALTSGAPGLAIPAALAGTGMLSKAAADAMTRANTRNIMATILRGGTAASRPQLPPEINRAALASALAARSELPRRESTP